VGEKAYPGQSLLFRIFFFLNCKPIVDILEVILEIFNPIFAFGVKLFIKVITFQLAGFKANLYLFDIASELLVATFS
jgi:hypothetical protein